MKEKYELFPPFPMEKTQRKIEIPAELLRAVEPDAGPGAEEQEGVVKHTPVIVDEYRIDTNGHVNNAQYLRIAEAVSPAVRQARKLRIEYRKQAYEGDVILPVVYRDDMVLLCASDGDPYAIISAQGERTERRCSE